MTKETKQVIEPIDASFDDVASVIANDGKSNIIKKVSAKESGMLEVKGVEIHLLERGEEDYISLTDMASGFDGEGDTSHIESWLRSKNTVDFLGVWEKLNNPNFNSVEFDGIRMESGSNRFKLSAKQWVQKTNGIGLIARTGRYGGTFAHKDIAFEFGSWLSPEFKLYLIKEFERLKEQESSIGQLEWNVRRTLAKAQYRVHTDAIKNYLIPPEISKKQEGFIYASEADILNTALFGMTAKDWKTKNPEAEGTQRDNATIEQLVVLASLESQNALLIQQGRTQQERLLMLNELARKQMQSLLASSTVKKLSDKPLFLK